ncbi:MAG TPA: 16S rRNA (guanine(527)-N(7))-methyltransferase RsmG [Smithellaceae bacterium]|jgi:16S rRNA (guanine527-N7)-methyltransferase|nr:16S rRNA (guanine(527)-N(7))-methyltransferase RsmG [Syntrophaceae bacterium]HPV48424.1 16S rRNA (guanine(527)-N(7))-methyltransferase RsmG [Smithellaceae bacterium]
MSEEMQLLKDGAARLGIELDNQQLCQFDVYRSELLKWNEKINLISEKSAGEIINRHFLDSLSPARYIPPGGGCMLDAGSGAGFPGIPLKIAHPDIKLHLLEANRKKISFLKNVIRSLKLNQTQIIHDRTENVLRGEIWRGKFEILVSRAAFKLPYLLELADYFLGREGLLITLRGEDLAGEISQLMKDPHISTKYLINQYITQTQQDAPLREIIVFQKVG